MELTTTMAKNMYKVITSGAYYDKDKMLSDIEASLKRNRITVAEAEYLRGLVEADLEAGIQKQLKQLGK